MQRIVDEDRLLHDLLPVFYGGDAPDIEADRCVELQGVTACSGLRVSEHDADFLPDLIDENNRCHRFADRCGQLSERLRHEPRLEPHVCVAHFAFYFCSRHKRRYGIDNNNINGGASDKNLGNIKGLFA